MSEPIAYAAVAADGSEAVYVASLKEQAEAFCRESGWFLFPLGVYPATWPEEVASVEAAFERSGVKPTWPDDEPGNIGPMAAAMADEITRLRLADEEREAIEDAIRCCEYMAAYKPMDSRADLVASAATLRGLLERMR